MNKTRKTVSLLLALLLTFTLLMSAQAQDGEPIAYGDTVEGELTGEGGVRYTFEASAGDVLLIGMSSEDFDTRVFLEDANGMQLTSNDDGGEGLNSLIRGFTIEEDGTYVIIANGFSETAVGTFTLTLDTIEPIAVTLGEPVTVTFDGETSEFNFAFEGRNGQVIDVAVDSGNALDTRMEIISPFEFILAESMDGGGTVDPSLSAVVLDTDGLYFIVVQPQNPNASLTGDITLTVSEASLESLDDGPLDLMFNFESTASVVAFEAEAGETVRLNIMVETESDFISPFFELSQNGEQFANFNMGGSLTQISVDLVVPASGVVNLSVQAFNEIAMTIELERPE